MYSKTLFSLSAVAASNATQPVPEPILRDLAADLQAGDDNNKGAAPKAFLSSLNKFDKDDDSEGESDRKLKDTVTCVKILKKDPARFIHSNSLEIVWTDYCNNDVKLRNSEGPLLACMPNSYDADKDVSDDVNCGYFETLQSNGKKVRVRKRI